MGIKDILVLTMVKGIGPATIKKNFQKIVERDSYLDIVKELQPDEIENCLNYERKAEEILAVCGKEEIEVISINSVDYPKRLLEISNPPAILYIKGKKSLLNDVIAIIGTRHSTPLGNKIAEKLGAYFSQKYSICNGLVEGIDEHSIYVNGKILPNVIGVISGGLCFRETCSRAHAKVIEEVLNAGGLIISEFPPMQKEDQYSGGNSSRIQAGLSMGVILVQSKIDGGSKYTLGKFVKLNRVLGIIKFESSLEYQDDVFAANRLILEKGIEGLVQFVGLKTDKVVSVKSIIPIENRNDYKFFEDRITLLESSLFL